MATPSTTAETSNRGSADVDLERGAEGEGDNHAAAIAPTSTKSTSSDVRNSDEKQPNLAQRVSRSLKRKRRKLISPLTADVSDDRYDHWKYEALEDHPDGWPRMAAYLNLSDNALIYRKFGYLRNRVLLNKQAEIIELEERLHNLDLRDQDNDEWRLFSRSYDNSQPTTPRRALLQQIEDKLREYDDLLFRQQKLVSIGKPNERDHLSLFNWVWNNKPVVNEDFDFMFHKTDLVKLENRPEDNWFDGMLQDLVMAIFNNNLVRFVFGRRDDNARIGEDKTITFLTPERIDTMVKIVMACITMLLLIIPVILLYVLNTSKNSKLGIVLAWIFLFAVVTATFTQSRRYEVIAGTAAYAAVLTVFLGQQSPGSASGG